MSELDEEKKGLLSWFATNHVAANLLMLMIIAGGILSIMTTTVELFPDTSVDVITVTVPYLGASPEEVEEGVCVRVEEAVAGIDGLKRLTSVSSENSGTVIMEIENGYNIQEILDDVKAEVDRIITFPKETEKPIINEVTIRHDVLSIVIYGDVPERTLRNVAERMRDDLTAMDNISQVDLLNARDFEISIEVSEENLRKFSLTFNQISNTIAESSLDLPGGLVKTTGGEILIRTKGQRYTGSEFENIVIVTRNNGTQLLLSDIADVIDGFEDSDLISRFDGKRSVLLKVYRVGRQDVLGIEKTCKEYLIENRSQLPTGISTGIWSDQSLLLKSRITLLLKNAIIGLTLVFLILSLFLDLKLAFWTTIGIPTSFMGAFWLMPYFGVSINMISVFAFILALGIVVDDAIVVGENIFSYRQKGATAVEAAIAGVKEMAGPVTMAVITTIFAFAPLLYIYGVMGKFIRVIPVIVISILFFSLIEALLILPAHLSKPSAKVRHGFIYKIQKYLRGRMDGFVENKFAPIVEKAVAWRYLTISIGVAVLMITIGVVKGGHIKFTLFPKVDADNVWVSVSLPQGTSIDQTEEVVEQIELAAEKLRTEIDEKRGKDENGFFSRLFNGKSQPESIIVHVSTTIGEQPFTRDSGGGPPAESGYGSNYAEVNIELLSSEKRGNHYPSAAITGRWRELVGEIAGVSSMTFTSSFFSVGDAVNVEMSHHDFDTLILAVEDLKILLGEFPYVTDIDDNYEEGKIELKLNLTDHGRMLGLTLGQLARQVRQGFYGHEVQRIQRGRNDIKVMVRYPVDDRKSIADIENMRIRLSDGTETAFNLVARVERSRGSAMIRRAERLRVINVTADVDQTKTTSKEINSELQETTLPDLKKKYPGLFCKFEGEQKENKEIFKSLSSSFLIAILAIFGLLAVQFRSYTQPAIIMSAIPFGLVGAIAGHFIMGFYLTIMGFFSTGTFHYEPYNLSILSIFGIVALTGIVVNDSLIMIDLINRERREGIEIHHVIRDSVTRRFRPIILTTMTTFAGLVPMMLEKSLQARFLIPMAVSLAFGVFFATMITLLLVPSLYMILEDAKNLFNRKEN